MMWIHAYDELHRPTILDLREYLSVPAMRMLERFNAELFQKYRVKAAPPRYTQKSGWVFPYRRQGVHLLSLTIQDETGFAVDGFVIRDEAGLAEAFSEVDRRCQSGFLKKAEDAVAVRKERARVRRASRQDAGEVPSAVSEAPPGSDPQKLNKFSWVPALPPDKLRRLYRSSARGMLDLDLLEGVGIQLYVRCQQGTEEFALIRSGKLKCHHCGAVLPRKEGLMECECGFQYTFPEYSSSFNSHHMPGGNATHIFSEFVKKWPGARTDSAKMNLIDWMVHQCHISMASGLPLRSVLKNLIDAPQKTAEKLVLELAYDNTGI